LRRCAALLVLIALAGCGGGDEPPRLVAELREGGLTLVMRHATTESAIDRQERLGSCALQRNLTDAGRAQARAIGEALRSLDVPIGDVRASPMCRTRETAELAFGRARIDRSLVTPGVIGTVAGDDRRAERLRALVREPVAPGANRVLVTHTGNIGALGQSVAEGELLLYDRGRLAGRIKPEEWPDLVAAAQDARG
jgi:phosphohistidine phosphatase SixA